MLPRRIQAKQSLYIFNAFCEIITYLKGLKLLKIVVKNRLIGFKEIAKEYKNVTKR